MAPLDVRAPGRVAVIGDLGGHLTELRAEMVRLGADPETHRLPDDLTVVQVGDLVHKGPDSDGVVALIAVHLQDQPDQWVQLAGNHEAQYLREPDFDWPETISDDAIATLRTWWSTGQLRIAAAVQTPDEDFLITHAGLTEGFWRLALDSPTQVRHAAAAINSFIGTHDAVLFSSGEMLGGGPPKLSAGPVWASAAIELVPSWRGSRLPFSQVHGHSSIMDWRRRQLRGTEDLARLVHVDFERSHEIIESDGGRIIGIDPGHGRRARHPWRAFVIENASVYRG